MVTLCWAAKGGSGTTVTTTAMALSSTRPSLLVDLDGEIPEVLGLPKPARPGIAEWLTSDAPSENLENLLVDIGTGAWLLPWRGRYDTAPTVATTQHEASDVNQRWRKLAHWLNEWSLARTAEVTIDAGTGEPNAALFEEADRTLLVTRSCYLSLTRAVASPLRPSGVVLLEERGHALSRRHIENALSVPVCATVSLDIAVARAVDSGLLRARLPRVISRELRQVAA
jgi:hypothetical protein